MPPCWRGMADERRVIRSVAVLGGGIVGLSAALAIRHALPSVDVTVIETPPDPAALADRLTTAWPSISAFHGKIGLTERDLVRRGAAMPLLGTRIVDAGSGRPPWYLVHGQYGVPIGSVPFHQIWARAWREGGAQSHAHYSVAAVLAATGQFVHPELNERSPLSTYDYGLRIDPPRYRDVLAACADAAGIARIGGTLADLARHEDGRVATLTLSDGRAVAADLYLDCSGPAALLLSRLTAPLRRWDADLADTLVIAQRAAVALESGDTIVASSGNWTATIPLRDRTMEIVVSDGHVAHSGSAGRGDEAGERVRIRPGWRDPWCANVVAIGDAAIAAAPVPGFHLHLAYLAIARVLDLLPGRNCDPYETSEYRRRAVLQAIRLGDFLALFQCDGRSAAIPDGLADVIEQFVRRGRFAPRDDDAISSEVWIAALIGRGYVPQASDAVATAVQPAVADALLADLSRGFASLPGQLPTYPAYLERWSR